MTQTDNAEVLVWHFNLMKKICSQLETNFSHVQCTIECIFVDNLVCCFLKPCTCRFVCFFRFSRCHHRRAVHRGANRTIAFRSTGLLPPGKSVSIITSFPNIRSRVRLWPTALSSSRSHTMGADPGVDRGTCPHSTFWSIEDRGIFLPCSRGALNFTHSFIPAKFVLSR